MSTFTPPVPAQRKIKLTTALKTTLSEQSTKLQTKCELEHDLLEDIRSYAKQRASMEKEYAQGILKITSQLLVKIQSKEEAKEEEQFRSPYGLWQKLLEDTEAMANARMKMSQTLLTDVVEGIKNLKSERLTTIKKCASLAEKLHEEVIKSAADLVKAKKAYTELQKLTIQASEHASDAQEKFRKGNVSIFSSKAKLEKNVCKANERRDASAKRSTIARNDYLLTLAALNAHQWKYYSLDLPDLIAVQDGKIYENFKDYYMLITNAERQACKDCLDNLDTMEGNIALLERAYAIQGFLRENPVFTKCDPYEYIAVPEDEVHKISDAYGAGLPLNKEARKWMLRLAREHKAIRKKSKELLSLKAATTVDAKVSNSNESCPAAENLKTKEQAIEVLTEEIRHLEVIKTKAEGRVEALKQAGVNVDEWLQGALMGQDEEMEECGSLNMHQFAEEDDFADEEWDDSSTMYNFENYSDDGLSVSSSLGRKSSNNLAVVLYPFQANSQEELSINIGEELELLETEGDGWCKTRNKCGEIGFVPETYIEIRSCKSASVSDDGETASKGSAHELASLTEVKLDSNSTTPSSSLHADACVTSKQNETPSFACFARAIYDYDGIEEEELSFREGDTIMVTSKMVDDDAGWWEGILNCKYGVFPSLVVEETKPPDPSIDCQDDIRLNPPLSKFPSDECDNIPPSRILGQCDQPHIESLFDSDENT